MAVHETPHLKEFMNGLFECRYAEFYKTFPGVLDQVSSGARAAHVECALPVYVEADRFPVGHSVSHASHSLPSVQIGKATDPVAREPLEL